MTLHCLLSLLPDGAPGAKCNFHCDNSAEKEKADRRVCLFTLKESFS